MGSKMVAPPYSGHRRTPMIHSPSGRPRYLARRRALPSARSRVVLPDRVGRTGTGTGRAGQADLFPLPGANAVPAVGAGPGRGVRHLGRDYRARAARHARNAHVRAISPAGGPGRLGPGDLRAWGYRFEPGLVTSS